MTTPDKLRLDRLLTNRGLAPTRSRARDLIKRGIVSVNGFVEKRAGVEFREDIDIALAEEWSGYVSRGSLKLAAALDAFGFDCADRTALDIGASTGGFTQILLRGGARKVYAVDTGTGQLEASLNEDARVINLEKTDARRLDRELIREPISVIAADVSFISLTKVLPAGLALAAPGAWSVALVKPQFEVGPERVGKGGIVRDEAARREAVASVRAIFEGLSGWRIEGNMPSPIEGQSGNIEYLIGATYAP